METIGFITKAAAAAGKDGDPVGKTSAFRTMIITV